MAGWQLPGRSGVGVGAPYGTRAACRFGAPAARRPDRRRLGGDWRLDRFPIRISVNSNRAWVTPCDDGDLLQAGAWTACPYSRDEECPECPCARSAHVRASRGGSISRSTFLGQTFAGAICQLTSPFSLRGTRKWEMATFDFIEGFYNIERRHSSIEYSSPINYEKKYRFTA